MAFVFIESWAKSSSVVQNAGQAVRVLVLIAGVVWSAAMVRGAIMSFSWEIVVGFWSSIACILSSPLYICIIINSIVLLIAASSTFHHHDPPPPSSTLYDQDLTIPANFDHHPEKSSTSHDLIPSTFDHRRTYVQSPLPEKSRSTVTEQFSHPVLLQEKSSSAALCDGNDYASSSPATKNIEGITSKEEEATMEAINKQLRKSETFGEAAAPAWKDLRKWETFNESVSKRRVGGLMRDPSLGIHEFNHQVEAFIQKFNANMRLQRQESDQRFLDHMNIINKGSL